MNLARLGEENLQRYGEYAYTAGTTGRPKGVARSHGTLVSNARAATSLHELDRTAWGFAVLPLSHSYGLTVMNAGAILGSSSERAYTGLRGATRRSARSRGSRGASRSEPSAW